MTDFRAELLVSFEGERDEHLAAMRWMLTLAEREGFDSPNFDVEDVYRRAHSLKGAARAVDLTAVEAVAHRLETLLDALFVGAASWTLPTLRGVRQALDSIEDLAAAEIRGAAVDPAPALVRLDTLLRNLGLDVPMPAAPAMVRQSPSTPRGPGQLRIDSEALETLLKTTAALLAEVSRQDGLATKLRELHLASQRTPEAAARLCAEIAGRFESRSWRLGRLATALQDDLQRARLLPVEAAFGNYPRMARELARDLGKSVEVDVQGFAAHADRTILQSVADAVLHLLRNAISHGIESPAERSATGKPPEGRIGLRASHEGGRLVLIVEDDGRGLDEDAIVDRAIRAGIITGDDVVTPQELIFRPGLSTAGSVTALSGRGMGMAIVRQVVRRLNGTITVASRPGRGTRFTLSLPVSLVKQRLVLVRIDEQSFALPADAVEAVDTLPASAAFTVEGQTRARLGDGDLRLVWLAPILGLPAATPSETLAVVVLAIAGPRVALVVDQLVAAEDWPVAALPAGLDRHPLLSGLIGLADGSLAFVLSAPALAAAADAMPQAPPPTAPRKRRPKPTIAPLILVVDDSVTTRTLERSILETHGYRVVVAVNGKEALERLAAQKVDLVISDIEMPLMDGFALLKSMKGIPRLASIPVILVTSKESPADRMRGLRLGADAYIVKRHFSQADLLDAIRQLLP